MLGALTLPSWGTLRRSWGDPGTFGSTRKDTVRSRLGFYRFVVDLRDPFWSLLDTFGRTINVFLYLSPGCLFWWFVGLNLGVWDWKTKHAARDFGWHWSKFSWLLLPWRKAWKLLTLQGDSGSSQILSLGRLGGSLVGPKPLTMSFETRDMRHDRWKIDF